NIRDWNISRQIVWGIRIPAWFRGDEIHVGRTTPKGEGWIQDSDVLDTWFSSGQWPFLTLGYPKSRDYKTFYPTDVMETGYDILFFWVARMIMLGLYRTGKVPFRTVYLHGLVRDKDRQKMSKSKGNVIDPLGVAELYGTDAVRMALVIGNTAGNDIIISEEKIRGYRNFANKLWNIHRFIMLRSHSNRANPNLVRFNLTRLGESDRKRLTELKALTKRVTADLERFRFHHAADALYHYTWHTFADKIIESVKPRLESKNSSERLAAATLLLEIHTTLLKLLHPFMPYLTEELWQNLGGTPRLRSGQAKATKGLLMVEPWPH
ncbi:MAG: class I tRNA ligase family protein, partial [Patescibacteria group bacterium]